MNWARYFIVGLAISILMLAVYISSYSPPMAWTIAALGTGMMLYIAAATIGEEDGNQDHGPVDPR